MLMISYYCTVETRENMNNYNPYKQDTYKFTSDYENNDSTNFLNLIVTKLEQTQIQYIQKTHYNLSLIHI